MDREQVLGISIDSAHTRDVDDAVWVVPLKGGTTRVFVTIADVASVVPPRTTVDLRARERVVTEYRRSEIRRAMLPMKLISEASLLPEVERKGITLQITVQGKDARIDRIYPSLYKGFALSYSEIPEVRKNKNHPLHTQVKDLYNLAQELGYYRKERESLVVSDVSNGWVSSEEGFLRKLDLVSDAVGYVVVQELMILANRCLAEYAVEHNLPLIYRNHVAKSAAPPRRDILDMLALTLQDPTTHLELTRRHLHLIMGAAEYDVVVKGHYGLNIPAYLHFTSPLRRYVDLVNHHQILAWVTQQPLPYTQEELREITSELKNYKYVRDQEQKERARKLAEEQAKIVVVKGSFSNVSNPQMERILKVYLAEQKIPSQQLCDELCDRMRRGVLPVLQISLPFVRGGEEWKDLRKKFLELLVAGAPGRGTSVFHAISTTMKWPETTYTCRELDKINLSPVFQMTACQGNVVSKPVNAFNLKRAKELSHIYLIAALFDIDLDLVDETTRPLVENPKLLEREGQNPVCILNDYASKIKTHIPKYTFKLKGDKLCSHVCEGSFLGHTVEAIAISKHDAKKQAAEKLLEKLKRLVCL